MKMQRSNRHGVAATILLFGFLLLLAVALFVGSQAIYTLDEAEQAIVLQFGAPVGDPVVEPGLHFKRPFIQEVRRFDKRLLSWDGDPNQIPTRGEQFISVDTTARWRIVEPLVFFRRVRDERQAQNRLNDILDSVVRDHIAANELVEIVRSEGWKLSDDDIKRVLPLDVETDEEVPGDVPLQVQKEILQKAVTKGRGELVASILETAQKQMAEYGIELVDIRLKRLDYVADVQKRVFDRMIEERRQVAAQFRSEGRGLAAEIDGQTDHRVSVIQSEAERDARIIQGEADAAATKIYNEAFGADREFYAFFRTLESYSKSLGKDVTLILDADSDYFRYLRRIGDPEAPPLASEQVEAP